jgi:hypothetical protein
MKKPKVNYFEIKRRMVELVYILRCRPEDTAARNELRILKNECPMGWLEIQPNEEDSERREREANIQRVDAQVKGVKKW